MISQWVFDYVIGDIAMAIPFVRSPYNYDRRVASLDSALRCTDDEDMTQQQFKDECDINTLMERFGVTGHLPAPIKVPLEGDFTDVDDYHGAVRAVRQAEEEFMKLPSKWRVRFNYDPQAMMDFVHNPDNRDEAIKLGFFAPPPPVPVVVPPVAEAPKAAP